MNSVEFRKKGFIESEFVLKLFAYLFMTLDHIGYFLTFNDESSVAYQVGYAFRILGRIAFPLFIFMLCEGMRYTHSRWKYLLRIGIIYSLITIGETVLVYGFNGKYFTADSLDASPFCDLFFVALTLILLNLKGWKKLYAILPIAFLGLSFGCGVYDHYNESNIILWFPRYLRAGYNLLGLALALLFFYTPNIIKSYYHDTLEQNGVDADTFLLTSAGRRALNIGYIVSLIVVIVAFWGLSYTTSGREISIDFDMSLETYALLAIPFIYLYNGERGYDSKAFRIASYLYFPVHLAIIWAVFLVI